MRLTHYQKLGLLTTIVDQQERPGEFTMITSRAAHEVYDVLRQDKLVTFDFQRVMLTEKGRKIRREQVQK
jgi:hypothetical protein